MKQRKTAPNHLEIQYAQKGYRYIVGIDEAGRGAWAGPLALGAVILTIPEKFNTLNKSFEGVYDSKLLDEATRNSLYEEIENEALYHNVFFVDNKDIDKDGLTKSIEYVLGLFVEWIPTSLKDRDVVPATIDNLVYLLDAGLPLTSITTRGYTGHNFVRGDQLSISIAAASIMAKVKRDKAMCDLSQLAPVYQWHKNKGYGTQEHIKSIEQYGVNEYHRFSLKPIKKYLKGL